MTDEDILKLYDRVTGQMDKMAPMSIETLLDMLADPGDLDNLLVLNELFQRGALYQIIEMYPGDKAQVIDRYNEFCLVKKEVTELTVSAAITVD